MRLCALSQSVVRASKIVPSRMARSMAETLLIAARFSAVYKRAPSGKYLIIFDLLTNQSNPENLGGCKAHVTCFQCMCMLPKL